MSERVRLKITSKRVKLGKLIPKKILFKIIYVGEVAYGRLRESETKRKE